MVKSSKIRKGPSVSATKFSSGTKKKGNDGNMWKIVKNINGVQRWMKISKKNKKKKSKKLKRRKAIEKDLGSAWGKNKLLEKFWQKLASGKEVVLIFNNGTHEMTAVPSGQKNRFGKFNEFDNNPEIKAVLISNQSSDAYELLYKKAKNKSVNEVIKNYKKYFKSTGKVPADLIKQGFPLMKKVLYPF